MTRDIERALARVADELSSARDAIKEDLGRYVHALVLDDAPPPSEQEDPPPID